MYPAIKKEAKLLLTLYFLFSTLIVTVSYGASIPQKSDSVKVIQMNQLARSVFSSDIDEAELISKKALRISQQLGFEKGEVNSLKLLAEINYKRNRFDKAVFYYELYTSKNDSIQKVGSEKSVALLNAKYDFEVREAKTEKEEGIKQKNLESIIEEKKVAQSKLMIFFIFIAISLIIIICYVFLLKNRNKALLKQQYEIEKLSEKQSEIIEIKTSELLASNDTISHYAFLNSHELRAPLAKILSIVYLFDQMNITEDAFSKLLKESAKELEEAVGKIILELQNNSDTTKGSNN